MLEFDLYNKIQRILQTLNLEMYDYSPSKQPKFPMVIFDNINVNTEYYTVVGNNLSSFSISFRIYNEGYNKKEIYLLTEEVLLNIKELTVNNKTYYYKDLDTKKIFSVEKDNDMVYNRVNVTLEYINKRI